MSETKRTSRCMCGEVEIELTGEPAVMAYCHCSTCRGWLGAPIHAATGWPSANVRVVTGAERLGLYKRTEASHRRFCASCGTPVLVEHPALGVTDVPAGGIRGLAFEPSMHVHYGERVLSVKDGLPKFRDFPKGLGGSGEVVAE